MTAVRTDIRDRVFNHIPDKDEPAEHEKWVPVRPRGPLPAVVDLRAQCPPIYDQGQLGSCTANAICFVMWYAVLRQWGIAMAQFSRLFQYYFSRMMEGTTQQDSGAMLQDAIRVPAFLGTVPETAWPYDITKYRTMPPSQLLMLARQERAVSYRAIPQTVDAFRLALNNKMPVVFGCGVYDSFDSGVGGPGVVPMPKQGDKVLGGHAMAVVGYNDNTKLFIVRNSWGTAHGDKGYYYMPYDYLMKADLSNSFWSIDSVAKPTGPAARL